MALPLFFSFFTSDAVSLSLVLAKLPSHGRHGGPASMGETLKLSCVTPKPGSDIYLLGANTTALKWATGPDGVTTITVPKAMTAKLPNPGYSFKITGQPAAKC